MKKNSIRNHLKGKILEIISDKVVSEVVVKTSAGTISAIVTTRSVKELKLKKGDPVAALVKATNVSIELR